MKNLNVIEIIKKLTISALVSDDTLMGILVLKGGNALNLAYEITDRGSIDIDFSMEKDFTELEKGRLRNQIEFLLKEEFSKENLVTFDVLLNERPQTIDDSVKTFWGGYLLEFKVIEKEKFDSFSGNLESIRRNAIKIKPDQSTKFTVDISKYEYVGDIQKKDIEGAIVNVYSPEMIALEKLRAICQQNENYRKVVIKMTPRPRPRDFYDIFNLNKSFVIDFKSPENITLCQNIFDAKKVPLNFISEIPLQRDFHSQAWQSVVDTVGSGSQLKEFDYYFDFVVNQFAHLTKNL